MLIMAFVKVRRVVESLGGGRERPEAGRLRRGYVGQGGRRTEVGGQRSEVGVVGLLSCSEKRDPFASFARDYFFTTENTENTENHG